VGVLGDGSIDSQEYFLQRFSLRNTVKRLSGYLKRRLGDSTILWKIVHQHEMTRNLLTIIKVKEEY
jgi:hypothetical protein